MREKLGKKKIAENCVIIICDNDKYRQLSQIIYFFMSS